MDMRRIGVIGAGVMGVGVAQCAASISDMVTVTLIDNNSEQLAKARGQIRHNVRFQHLLDPGSRRQEPSIVLNRIAFTTDYGELCDTDFIIENVVEQWNVKEQVYRKLDAICPAHCIFAANPSACSITRLGSATQRPETVIGMHFMNPVPLKPTVEVIRGHHTSDGTLNAANRLIRAMGKDSIVVRDMPGFVSNRVLMVTINEAIFLVQDQVATVEDIDRLFKSCFGHKMGPLETADLIGLDTILYSLDMLYESYNDTKYRPCPLLKNMVWAGLHGKKSNQGFYDYHTALPVPQTLVLRSPGSGNNGN